MTVTTAIAVTLMTTDEARACVGRIKSSAENVRSLMLDLYERDGWKALGYDSWRECAASELEQSLANVYRVLNAARVDRVLSHDEKTVVLPLAQATALARLDEPEAIRETWEEIEASTPEGDVVTAERVRKAVSKRLGPLTGRPVRAADEPTDSDEDRAAAMVGTANEGHDWKPRVPPVESTAAPRRSGIWMEPDVDSFVNYADSQLRADEIREVIDGLTRVLADKDRRASMRG